MDLNPRQDSGVGTEGVRKNLFPANCVENTVMKNVNFSYIFHLRKVDRTVCCNVSMCSNTPRETMYIFLRSASMSAYHKLFLSLQNRSRIQTFLRSFS